MSASKLDLECTQDSFNRRNDEPLRIVWFNNIAPFAYNDLVDGRLIGSDIDTMKTVTASVGVEVEFTAQFRFDWMRQMVRKLFDTFMSRNVLLTNQLKHFLTLPGLQRQP